MYSVNVEVFLYTGHTPCRFKIATPESIQEAAAVEAAAADMLD